MALGVTFAPGSQDPMQQRRPQQPVQEAIKLLSLRLPQVVGANSPIPAPLLTAPGGMGQPDPTGNPLLDLLRKLLGGQMPPGGMPDLPAVPMGMPRWTPGGGTAPEGSGGPPPPPMDLPTIPAPPAPMPLPQGPPGPWGREGSPFGEWGPRREPTRRY